MAPIRRDMVSLEINVVSGTLAKMHLTFHTNSEDAESLCFNQPHAFSLCLSRSLCPNWSSRSDNPVLSALISSQACLSITDWSQMASLGEDGSSFYQKDRQHRASPKPKRPTENTRLHILENDYSMLNGCNGSLGFCRNVLSALWIKLLSF